MHAAATPQLAADDPSRLVGLDRQLETCFSAHLPPKRSTRNACCRESERGYTLESTPRTRAWAEPAPDSFMKRANTQESARSTSLLH